MLSNKALLFLLVATTLPGPAYASTVGSSSSPSDLLITTPVSVPTEELHPSNAREALAAMDAFSRSTRTRWQVQAWTPSSITPSLAVGSGIDLGARIEDEADAEAAARDFVIAHPQLFQTHRDRLGPARVRSGLGKWSVSWQENVDGMPILHSRVVTLLTDSGRLAAFGATTFPTITRAETPLLSTEEARAVARAHLTVGDFIPTSAELVRDEVRGPFLLPVETSDGIVGRTIFRATFASLDPPAAYDVDVDAVTGEVLQRQSVLRHDYLGTADGSIEFPRWCEGWGDRPLPHLTVNVSNVGSATTTTDGSFLLPSGASSTETLTAALSGPFVQVLNLDGENALATGTIEPDVPFLLHWEETNSLPQERDVFYSANATHEMIKSCDPSWSDMDYPLPARVNYDGDCNAFWNGSSITFFKESSFCADSGRLSDVVAHEYVHGVTDFMYGEDDPPGALHEGNSDVAANYLINDPEIGVGMHLPGCEHGFRNSDNDLRWPEDVQGQGHWDGQIIAGFHWHARAAMIANLGYDAGASVALQDWHFARLLGLPRQQPDQVWWTFLADDDDGNLDNGTPHYAELVEAAIRHGFAVPEAFEDVVIHHGPPICAASTFGSPITMEATIYSFAAPVDPDSLLLFYRESGDLSFQSAPFVPTGEDDSYSASVPGIYAMGTTLEYSLLAVDMDGNRLRRPAAGIYSIDVGFVCDDFEEESGWTVGAPGDGASPPSRWTRVDPVGRYSPSSGWIEPADDATPDPRRFCWITGESASLTGATTLVSPVYQLEGATWATVAYRRWFYPGSTGKLDITISYDGGSTWNLLERVEAPQELDWHYRTFRLDPPIGGLGSTQFRVKAAGFIPSSVEAGFDDFVLLAGDGDPADVDPASHPTSTELELSIASSNPAPAMAFAYFMPVPGRVGLGLYAIDGSLVRVLVDAETGAGSHQVGWDGRDSAGARIPSGAYFARLSVGHESVSRRVLILR